MRRLIGAELTHLRRFARGLARDADVADDLVQDCVERALSKEHLFDPSRRLRPWLFQILRNLFANRQRAPRIGDADRGEGPEILETQAAPQNQLDHLAARQMLDALQRLPAEQREVMLLVCVEEMSYRETAEILGTPVGTVMSRLSRAREALRRICSETTPGDGASERPHLRRVK